MATHDDAANERAGSSTADTSGGGGDLAGFPPGVRLSSPGKRLAGYLLDVVLVTVTFVIGWLIWALVVFARGMTPAKQILSMRTVVLRDGEAAGWGRMFLREFIVAAILVPLTFGIAAIWLLWDRDRQQLYDKVVGTTVVDDPQRQLA